MVRIWENALHIFLFTIRDVKPFEILYYDYFDRCNWETKSFVYEKFMTNKEQSRVSKECLDRWSSAILLQP